MNSIALHSSIEAILASSSRLIAVARIKRISVPRSLAPLLVAIFLYADTPIAQAQAPSPFTWTSVAIGGRGYITGIVIHPLDSNLMYTRTDVGGAYRSTDGGANWSAITEWITLADRNLFGIESLAVDPTNPNVVYMVAGKDFASAPRGVYKSSDKGRSLDRSGNLAWRRNTIHCWE